MKSIDESGQKFIYSHHLISCKTGQYRTDPKHIDPFVNLDRQYFNVLVDRFESYGTNIGRLASSIVAKYQRFSLRRLWNLRGFVSQFSAESVDQAAKYSSNTKGPFDVVNSTSSQIIAEQTNHDHDKKQTHGSSCIQIPSTTNQKQGSGWLRSCVLLFIAANTFFLVHEQTAFFNLKGYTLWQSAFFAILIESALLLFSIISSRLDEIWLKTTFYLFLAATLFVNGMVVTLSVEKQEQKQMFASKLFNSLEQEIQSLKDQQQIALNNIKALDPEKYPTQRNKLLEKLRNGISKSLSVKIGQLNEFDLINRKQSEGLIMKLFRLLAIIWNILLVHFYVRIPYCGPSKPGRNTTL